MQEKFFIQTVTFVVTEDNTNQPIDLAAIGGVIDFSIINPLASNDLVITINGMAGQTLAAGDPMLMLGGYENCLRKDIITIAYTGGTGSAVCYMNKRVSRADCLDGH